MGQAGQPYRSYSMIDMSGASGHRDANELQIYAALADYKEEGSLLVRHNSSTLVDQRPEPVNASRYSQLNRRPYFTPVYHLRLYDHQSKSYRYGCRKNEIPRSHDTFYPPRQL